MAEPVTAEPCLSEVVLQVSVESLQVVPGLLAAAVVLGVLLGVAAAALLCFFAFLPRLRKKDDVRSLPENLDSNVMKGNVTKKRFRSRKTKTETQVPRGETLLEGEDCSAPSDVAAFALRAKVIYPINQKFRWFSGRRQ